MQRRIAPFVAAALAATVLTVNGPAPAGAAVADPVRLVGLTTDNKLVTFESGTPATLGAAKAITGLKTDDDLLGIDFRPATGQLFALGEANLYTIDPDTAVATVVGTEAFSTPLAGTKFGFDFNPAVDRIRVVSDTGQNLRLNPNDGKVAAADTALGFKAEDVNGGTTPAVTAAAYTNSFFGTPVTSPPIVTTLFDIDPTNNVLIRQDPPNGGVLNTVGDLTVDATDVGGFDIDTAPGKDGAQNATANVGLAALVVAGSTGLYTIDLTTGKASLEGPVGDGSTALDGMAIAPPTGYWMFGADGAVYPFGSAEKPGEAKGLTLSKPIVGAAATPSGEGYWLLGGDGGIFNYGDAPFFGSTGDLKLNKPVVGMAPYPDGNGYWLVASDGGIFSFPKAGTKDRFFGSAAQLALNKPIVGMNVYPNGNGYWLVAEDGGIFSYPGPGEADKFYGSTGDIKLAKPIKGMTNYPDGSGYWFVATDGGIFSYAQAGTTARFYGSQPERKAVPVGGEVVGIATSPTGLGYWMAGADGALYAFGDAKDLGNATTPKPAKPIVAIVPAF